MKRIWNRKDLKIDESYLVFIGYEYSPSGFDIGTLALSGRLKLQGGAHIYPTGESLIYELPEIAAHSPER